MIFSNLSQSLRNILSASMLVAAGTVITGCSEDLDPVEQPLQPESGYITLSLNCAESFVESSRSDYTELGKTTLNENLIKTAIVCLWQKDGTKADDKAKPDYVQVYTGLDAENTATLRVPLTPALQKVLFETADQECHAFVAVNVTPPAGEFTIAELRALNVGSTFSSRRTQESFAMDGDGIVTFDGKSASGNIDLQRSASKITLALAVDDEVEQTAVIDGKLVNSKWKPNTANMRVWLHGGLAESTLDPVLYDPDDEAKPSEKLFFSTPDNLTYSFGPNTDNSNNPGVDADGKPNIYSFVQDRPFYTYPHRWSAEPGDYAATYMTLAIPWQTVGEDGQSIPNSTTRTCYYQVPVIAADSDPLQLVRNVSYHVYLHVGLLGSFIPDEPLELTDLKYSAAEWGTVNMDVEIPDVRYLVVDQNDYTVNNETSIVIPFYTSHPTVVTDATMTFYRYNFDDVGRELPVTVSWNQNKLSEEKTGAPVFSAYFDNATGQLTVGHELKIYEGRTASGEDVSFTDNDGPKVGKAEREPKTEAQWQAVLNRIAYFEKADSVNNQGVANYDINEYSRVEFKITLQHEDLNKNGNDNFTEEITITQYPGMYITTVQNYCPTTSTSFTYNGSQGNTIINGNTTGYSMTQYYPSGQKENGWMTSIGLSTTYENFNPNMYLVTITTLPQGTPYKIGDPRTTIINNDLASNQTYTNTFTGTAKTLTTGVNGPVLTNENKTAWKGSKYSWSEGSVTTGGYNNATSIYYEGNNKTRTLSYYYPTLEDDDHKMMVAPKFRICSSYAGTTWALNRELARRRAAAFQELGYPAGRWRLPTFGEVSFIMELSAQYKIPRLFGQSSNTWYYWCAQGLVCVRPKNYTGNQSPTLPGDTNYRLPTTTNPDVQRARFVYDEWYWGEETLSPDGTIGSTSPVYTFTWGDKPY